MGWTEKAILALDEKRKAELEAQAREREARQQEPPPTAPEPEGVTLTEDDRPRINEEEKATCEQPQGASADPPETAPPQPIRMWRAVGMAVAVGVLLVVVMDYMADRRDAHRAHRAQSAIVAKAEARESKKKITASEYGAKWPFTIPAGELECIGGAVIMHAPSGTYNLNGNAMGRYKNTYQSVREIAKPSLVLSGRKPDPQAKMPPPSDMIQRGLDLCD